MMSEGFPLVHVRNMDLEDGAGTGVQGVEDRDRGVGECARIDEDRARRVASFMDPVDDLVFPVALMKTELQPKLGGERSAIGLDVPERLMSVETRFALPEQVQVRSVQNIDKPAHRLPTEGSPCRAPLPRSAHAGE